MYLNSKYCLEDQIQENDIGGECNTYADIRNLYKILIRKPEDIK
jgi:hypothetical protein